MIIFYKFILQFSVRYNCLYGKYSGILMNETRFNNQICYKLLEYLSTRTKGTRE